MWKTDRGAREGASIEDSGGGAAQNGDKRGGYFGSDLQRPVWQEMGLAAKAVKQGLLKNQQRGCSGMDFFRTFQIQEKYMHAENHHIQANMQLGGGGRRESTRCTIPMLQAISENLKLSNMQINHINSDHFMPVDIYLRLLVCNFFRWTATN
ncbi:hypothetical protein CFC21_000967 [Triticum aestivum]|uniref:Uncharacterized protein n=2 Tax=Triticum TaxID=4564 RepID=A0A9R0PZ62_TRITD|nr:hypothetical protein CFC21_000967 [Triticum aestivum]VAH02141.1 unnamed protein product [Triticum turgidum subsp. durum]